MVLVGVIGLIFLTLLPVVLVCLLAAAIYKYRYAYTACEVVNAKSEISALGILLAGAVLVWLYAVLM